MAVSDLNFLAPQRFMYIFGITKKGFVDLVKEGRLKIHRKTIHPLVKVESIAEALYPDHEKMILKRWDYGFASLETEFHDAVHRLKGFPKCFFKREENMPLGYYRVFYKRELLKVCIYVAEDFVRCVCYNRDAEKDLETIYMAFVENAIDWID